MFQWLNKNKPSKSPEGQPAEGLAKFKNALSKTGQSLIGNIRSLVQGKQLDSAMIDEIEETLIKADVGLDTAVYIADAVRAEGARLPGTDELMAFLKTQFQQILQPHANANQLSYEPGKVNIYLVVGVNGVGKTTFIGKLAHRFSQQGKQVVIAAGDTFRAAAEDQLAIWAERSGSKLVRRDRAESASVIFEALQAAKEDQADVLIIDTAGRLQNKFNLMEELKKIKQVIDQQRPEGSNYEALLVLDATTGQNALQQASVFKEAADLSGVVLTKLDGSAKGGIILAIAQTHGLPVKMVGVGEGIEDLEDFNPEVFIESLFEEVIHV